MRRISSEAVWGLCVNRWVNAGWGGITKGFYLIVIGWPCSDGLVTSRQKLRSSPWTCEYKLRISDTTIARYSRVTYMPRTDYVSVGFVKKGSLLSKTRTTDWRRDAFNKPCLCLWIKESTRIYLSRLRSTAIAVLTLTSKSGQIIKVEAQGRDLTAITCNR